MGDEKVLRDNEKLRKLKSMMNRIHASRSSKDTSTLPSCDLSDGQTENQHASITPSTTLSNDNSRAGNVIISVLFRCIEPVPYDSSVDSHPDACFNCRKKGIHRYKECREPKNYAFCLNCGRRGVEVHNCPRCYKAHREFEEWNRPVEPLPPSKCIERSIERNRDKSKVMNVESSEREQNCEWPDSQDSSRAAGFINAEWTSRAGRNPTRNSYEWRDSRTAGLFDDKKNRERRNSVRYDLQNSSCAAVLNAEKNSREGRNVIQNSNAEQNNTLGNYEAEYNSNTDDKLKPDGERAKDFNSEFLELMAAIRHLPNETQVQLIEHLIKERQTLRQTHRRSATG